MTLELIEWLYIIIAGIFAIMLMEYFRQYICNYKKVIEEKFEQTVKPLDISKYPIGTQNNDMYLLSEGENKDVLVHNAKCSKLCCAEQWPLPPGLLPSDPEVCKHKYYPSNLTCNSEFTSGCVCVDKKTHDVLGSRGGQL